MTVKWSIVPPQKVSDAEKCRQNGWIVGTRLVGDEGYGPTVIELTAIGRNSIMAITISHNGEPEQYQQERPWTLCCRDWKVAGVSPRA